MPSVDAHIPTERASRYLAQLCRHLNQMSRMRHQSPAAHGDQAPPAVRQVDWSDTAGTIRFSQGTCTLRATPDALALRVDADDEVALQRLQDGVTRRLETIGRRDRLTVHWRQSDPAPGLPVDAAAAMSVPTDDTPAQRPRRLIRGLAVAGLAALAIAVHLGLLGTTLATSAWSSWGVNIVLGLILVKVVIVGVHVLLGRVALRRRRATRHRTHGHAGSSAAADDPAHPREHTA